MAKQGVKRWAATFGNNDFGRLGLSGASSADQLPHVVTALAGKQVKQAAAGGAHSAFCTEDGEVWTAGLNDAGQLGHSPNEKSTARPLRVDLPDPVTWVSAGHYHTLALTTGGELWAWGRNAAGQLGQGGSSRKDERKALKVSALQGIKLVGMAAGAEHSLGHSDSGEVFSWGNPGGGRLGFRSDKSLLNVGRQAEPRLVRGLVGINIVEVQAGHQHSAAVEAGGQAFLFGSNRFSQLGLPAVATDQPMPTCVLQLQNIQSLALGGLHSVSVSGSGQVLTWGANQNGLLGLGSNADPNVPVPTGVPDVFARHVSAGWKHNAAITNAGELLTWGWGGSAGAQSVYDSEESSGGQLGRGNENDCWTPALVPQVVGPEGRVLPQMMRDEADGPIRLAWRVLQVSCGFNHTACTVEIDDDAPAVEA